MDKNLSQMMKNLNIQGKNEDNEIFYKFEIQEILSVQGKMSVEFRLSIKSKLILIWGESNNTNVLYGNLKKGNSSLIKVNATEDISGTAIVLIWDKFCSMLYPGHVELLDYAKVSCKHCLLNCKSKLLLRMWRILGDMHTPALKTLKKLKVVKNVTEDSLAGGWYEKFGYLPEYSSKEYLQAVKYLSTITMKDLEEIYFGDKRNLVILQNCFEFAKDQHVPKDNFPFSRVIRMLDQHLKMDHVDENVHKLFHELKSHIMTLPEKQISDSHIDVTEKSCVIQKGDVLKFKETKIPFERFQSSLKVIENSIVFYKIYK